jgi:hypothetical protein
MKKKKKTIKEIFDDIHRTDMKNEERATLWLKKKGFKIRNPRNGKRSSLPFDILATKGRKNWVIEVKGGARPPIKLSNFRKMLTMPKIHMVGVILVISRHPYLLSFNKRTYSAELAWLTRRRSN